MKDEDHRSEADVLESVDQKDYRRRNMPTDPLESWWIFSFTIFCCKRVSIELGSSSMFGLRIEWDV